MPARVRDRHLRHVVEALIRYAVEGNALTFQSERDDAELRITFMLQDAEQYHQMLSTVVTEDPIHEDEESSGGAAPTP
jgi:hypothetical protein